MKQPPAACLARAASSTRRAAAALPVMVLNSGTLSGSTTQSSGSPTGRAEVSTGRGYWVPSLLILNSLACVAGTHRQGVGRRNSGWVGGLILLATPPDRLGGRAQVHQAEVQGVSYGHSAQPCALSHPSEQQVGRQPPHLFQLNAVPLAPV